MSMTGAGDGRAEPSRPDSQRADFPRIVSRDGSRRVLVRGRRRSPRDAYHWLLTTPWWGFAAMGVAAYLLANTVFAGLYLVDPGGLRGARPGSFADAFFFSVQTIGTIGYGVVSPRNLYANLVMTAENFFGISFVAVATGLIFARVSRPTSRVMFTAQAVIAPFEGRPTLMFRAANQRSNQILEAQVQVILARQEQTAEGQVIRRMHDLPMRRDRSPLFSLTWTIMHEIDEDSPLHAMTADDMRAQEVEIVVVLSGVDDTFAQRVHARHSYLPGEIAFDKRFADLLSVSPDGRRVVDYAQFHALEDLPEPAQGPGALDAPGRAA